MIRSLSGFSKARRHTVPSEVNDATENFVRGIATEEIKADLTAKFDEIRKGFGYKRKEIEGYEPEDGSASIDTIDFTYSVTVKQDEARAER